nr:TauD/TfdA family dioxygenase [Micromonospora sp. DSM 115978]
ISLDLSNPLAEYLRGAFEWHIDGSMDEIPSKASVMSAHVVDPDGGKTEFASTYAAYEQLSEAERARCRTLRVVHSFEATQRPIYPNPTPEQRADWRRRGHREHPLVWQHQSGRRSLVFGTTASHVVGMDPDESRALLDDLLARATTPDRVFRHTWSVGDMVIWDNWRMLHEAGGCDPGLERVMHRTTIKGDYGFGRFENGATVAAAPAGM